MAEAPTVITVPVAPTSVPDPAAATGEPAPPPIPRLVVLGDSQAFVLLRNTPKDGTVAVGGAQHGGCDILGEVIALGDRLEPQEDTCSVWPQQWSRALERGADAVVVTLGLRQVFDPVVDGERIEVGSPRWEELYRGAIDHAVGLIRERTDAPVLWLDVPCYRLYGTAGEDHDAERLHTVNRVLVEQLGTHPGVSIAPYSSRVCTGDDGSDVIEGLRPDGVHMNDAAAADTWGWILGQLDLSSSAR